MKVEIEIPDELRAETAALLASFTKHLAERLVAGQRKRAEMMAPEWDKAPWETESRVALLRAVGSGNQLDVAAYAMLMWGRNYKTSLRPALMFFDLDRNLR